jgi:hypothetical protein
MPLGAGACPAGSSSAGYGVPDQGNNPQNAIFPDPRTGLPLTGRNINSATNDYTFTSDGRTQGMPTVNQLVYLAVKTVRGSAALSPSALQPLGLDLSKAQEIGPDFERQISAALASALSPLVRQGLITIVGLTWLPVDNPDGAAPWLQWQDNTTGRTFNTSVATGP